MSPDKVWAALRFYDRELLAHGYGVRQLSEAEYNHRDPLRPLQRSDLLRHCRWMVGHCLTVFKPEYDDAAGGGYVDPAFDAATQAAENAVEAREPLEKAMRWLAYIQGVCHAHGLYSCNELRDHSRGDGGVFKTPAGKHAAAPSAPNPDAGDDVMEPIRRRPGI